MLSSIFFLTVIGCGGESGFTSNDGDVNPIEGNAIMELSHDSLVWEDLEAGVTMGFDLEISSVGELNLVLYESRIISSGDGVFYLPDDWRQEKTIPPGGSLTMTVTAAFPEATAPETTADGILRIKCNDIESIQYELPLQANVEPEATDTGDTGPGEDPADTDS
ncbi:MAG: hypothetical protein VX519_02365 [Myxococcota bacterium]|nr:hypothetical protein [Myxococcota bacterium]